MWDERYGAEEYAYGIDPNDFLKQEAHRIASGGEVLCLADGEGRNGVWLAEQGFQVTSVDASAVGMAKADRLAAARSVLISTIHSDLAHYDLGENRWDGIVSIFCHLPPPLRKQVHGNIARALKPGGILLLEAYTPRQLQFGTGGPPVEEMTMSLASLEAELPGLEFVVAEELDREVVEGLYHTGTGAVVQLIGRRPD